MTQTAEKIEDYGNYNAATPMMQQYLTIKRAHSDYLLFYRMGDFYELFFDDAVIAAEALDIALTRRGKHEDNDIPMCGVPFHASEAYLQKLIKSGYKVAVCDQMENPAEAKKRGSKSVVKREVTRIITPGTLTEESLLEASSSNYLAAFSQSAGEFSLSWLDISTGEFFTSETTPTSLASDIARINPKELLIPDRMLESKNIAEILKQYKTVITTYVDSFFDSAKGERKLKSFFGVAALDSFGNFTRSELGSSGALIEYVEVTQKGKLPRLNQLKKFITSNFMQIDAATRANLELIQTSSGEYKGSLLHTINRTRTSAGARLLYRYMGAPLIDAPAINSRLELVQFFIDNPNLRRDIIEALKRVPDVERALSRICLGRGAPRDLGVVRDALAQEGAIISLFKKNNKFPPAGLGITFQELEQKKRHIEICGELSLALVDQPPILARDGGFIRENYSKELDGFRNAENESGRLKDELRDKYRKETGIDSLKIKDNNILGYFIEITAGNISKIPDYFTHRQTMAGAVRYTTPELRELENKIINARSLALGLEMEIFNNLSAVIIKDSDSLSITAHALAKLDVFASLAELAADNDYTRPMITPREDFEIHGGRHPVVERAVDGGFIANDCNLSDEEKLWLLTGPNMAGKSTFLRQNALIAIMAQIGSFVPAKQARIGVIDRVFSRVGAADDLARGRSTFMVEMLETASILNNATSRSLVILDEIGRGTATFDGLSIAWAVIEYLHDVNKCRGLFATHYHELTALAGKLPRLACYTMRVKEWQGSVVFLHEVKKGVADRSYGIHVGKLAGLPEAVITRAGEVLAMLNKTERKNIAANLSGLPLFISGEKENAKSEVEEKLKNADIDGMSPRDALEFLYTLKKLPNSGE